MFQGGKVGERRGKGLPLRHQSAMSYIRTYLIGLIAVFLLSSSSSQAQLGKFNENEFKYELESLKNDSLVAELRALFDELYKQESFFSVNLGYSNRLFSANNIAFNTQQVARGTAAFMPSLSYFNKTGLGLSATGYMSTFDGKPTFYQLAISPSFDHIGKKFMYGVSYSNYQNLMRVQQKNTFNMNTPYQHEVYGYAQMRSPWLRPFLSLGWATGKYIDISQAEIEISGDEFQIVDTSEIRLNDFSTTVGVSHTFSFSNAITKKGYFTLMPQLYLIGGLQQYSTQTKSIGFLDFPRSKRSELDRIRKRYNLQSTTISRFSMQTAAFSLNAAWYHSSVSISAGYFLGYYFENTTTNKLLHLFNLNLGFTF